MKMVVITWEAPGAQQSQSLNTKMILKTHRMQVKIKAGLEVDLQESINDHWSCVHQIRLVLSNLAAEVVVRSLRAYLERNKIQTELFENSAIKEIIHLKSITHPLDFRNTN